MKMKYFIYQRKFAKVCAVAGSDKLPANSLKPMTTFIHSFPTSASSLTMASRVVEAAPARHTACVAVERMGGLPIFAEVEYVSFSSSSRTECDTVLPSIKVSNTRIFSNADAHRCRAGEQGGMSKNGDVNAHHHADAILFQHPKCSGISYNCDFTTDPAQATQLAAGLGPLRQAA